MHIEMHVALNTYFIDQNYYTYLIEILAWFIPPFIPTHQNSKPLLMSRYTTVTHILFYK